MPLGGGEEAGTASDHFRAFEPQNLKPSNHQTQHPETLKQSRVGGNGAFRGCRKLVLGFQGVWVWGFRVQGLAVGG